jgi:hypothetical protein
MGGGGKARWLVWDGSMEGWLGWDGRIGMLAERNWVLDGCVRFGHVNSSLL